MSSLRSGHEASRAKAGVASGLRMSLESHEVLNAAQIL